MNQTPATAARAPMPNAKTIAKHSWLPHILSAVILAGAFLFYLQITSNTVPPPERTPNRYVVPAVFSGNVKIVFGVEGAPELALDDEGYRVIEIPRTGLLETSTPIEYGHAEDLFLRRLPGGQMQELTPRYISDRKVGRLGDNKEFFRLATELEARDARYREEGLVDENGDNILGNPYEIFVVSQDP